MSFSVSVEVLHTAERVLAWERQQLPEDAGDEAAIEAAFERFHHVMFHLIGTLGFEGVLRRAIHLTKEKHPWVGELVVTTPMVCCSRDRTPLDSARSGEPMMAGATALLATVFHLLGVFIREDLMRLQVKRAWGDVAFGSVTAVNAKEAK